MYASKCNEVAKQVYSIKNTTCGASKFKLLEWSLVINNIKLHAWINNI